MPNDLTHGDGRGPANIKDVSAAAGVSVATVSRVLNSHPSVSEAVRTRVKEAIDLLQYRPNAVARSLRTQRTFTIGAIVPNIENPHFAQAVRGIQDAAHKQGYTALVVNTDGDCAKEEAGLRSMLERQVDAVILASSTARPSESLAALTDHEVPVVAMDRALNGAGIDEVLVDTRKGTREAMQHLLTEGCSRIAFLSGPSELSTVADKLAGYRDGLRRGSLPFNERLILAGDYTVEGGYRQARELLNLEPMPDGVIIANNLMTLGALDVFFSYNVDIPSALAVVGYDESPWASVMRPRITVVAQPTYQLGHRSAERLFERLQQPHIPAQRVRLPPQLLIRDSSRRSSSRDFHEAPSSGPY